MNAPRPTAAPSPSTTATVLAFAPRAERPAREFGTGYGRSSGYASPRRYVSTWGPARFRMG